MRDYLKTSLLTAVAFTLLQSSSALAEAQPIRLIPSSPKVTYDAVGRPSMLKIHGEGKDLTLQLTRDGATIAGKMSFNPATLDSGISLRDRHAREKYLEVEKYPEASFEMAPITLPTEFLDETQKETSLPIKGKLTLHGVTREVEAKTQVKREGTEVEVQSTFEIKLPEYQVAIPSFAGIKVAEDVTLTVNFKVEWK